MEKEGLLGQADEKVEEVVVHLGAADEKEEKEMDEALEAAYADEKEEPKEPFLKRMRKKYEEYKEDQKDTPGLVGDESDEEPDEARAARPICSPCEPTSADVRLHRVNHHLPYRNWCPQCVSAKGKEMHHKKPSEEDKAAAEHALDQYGLDYAFFAEEPEFILIRGDK